MKVSPEFAARLGQVPPDQQISAIVLLNGPDRMPAAAGRRTAVRRKKSIDAVRVAGSPALQEIKAILKQQGGKLLSSKVSVLGSIPVVTTVSGLHEIAALPRVKAIMDNQRIGMI